MYERFISSSMLTGVCFGTRSAIRCQALGVETSSGSLDVEVLHVEGVVLDVLAARLDLVAHQRGEHQVGLGVVLGAHLQQRPHLGIHGGGPELLGIHLAEALVAVDGDALLAGGDEEFDQFIERMDGDVSLLLRRLAHALLRLGGELRRLVHRTAANRRLVACRARFVGFLDNRAAGRDDDVAVHRRDVAMVGEERAVLAGGDEVDADRVLTRVAARTILDVQQVAVVLLVALHRDRPRRRGQLLRQPVEPRLVGEILAVGAGANQRLDDLARMAAPLHHLQQLLVGDHLVQQFLELAARDLDPLRRHPDDARLGGALDQEGVELALVLDVGFALAPLGAEQRRLGDEHVAVLDDLRQLPVEEREQQRADVRAVDVGVGHDDDAVVAELLEAEVFRADAAAERGNHRLDLVAAEHLVEARLLDVQDLALQRQDRLEAAVASLLGRAAGRFTLDDVELALARIALLAIGKLAGQRAAVERAFAPHQVARLAGGFASAGRVDRLADDATRHRRVLLEIGAQLVVEDRLDDALHLGVAELRLGLPLELRVGNLDADDRGQAFANVLARDAFFQILGEIVLRGVGVDRAGERRLEAGEMRAAFVRVDVVGEGVNRLGVAVVPLQRDLGIDAVTVAAHVDRLLVDRRLVLVQVVDERNDAALVVELVRLPIALVVEGDDDAAVQERELAQALREDVEAEDGGLEHLGVGFERDLGAALLGRAGDVERRGRHAALIRLLVDLPVAPDFEVEYLRERVDHRDADAVQAAGDFIAVVVELAAGVKNGQHHFGGGLAARVLIDRNAAAVVDHRDRAVDVDGDVDLVAEPGQRLVDRVVDDLVDQVVQPCRTGRADVHGRPF